MVKPILWQSLMQACRSAYSVYKTRKTREEKVKKAKEQRLKDHRGKEEATEQKEAIMSMEKNLSVRNKRNARSKWLRGCTVRPTEGYRKP